MKRIYMTSLGKTRRGYTLIESLFSLACITLLIVAMLSVVRYLQQSAVKVEISALEENYVICVAETIKQDLDDGYDITAVNYEEDPRIANPSVKTSINIYFQEDVFGEPLYQVVVDGLYGKGADRQVSRFFLRGGT